MSLQSVLVRNRGGNVGIVVALILGILLVLFFAGLRRT